MSLNCLPFPKFTKISKRRSSSTCLKLVLGDLWEKQCLRVQADIIEDLKKIDWEKDPSVCRKYINLLHDIAVAGSPFPELIEKNQCQVNPSSAVLQEKRNIYQGYGKYQVAYEYSPAPRTLVPQRQFWMGWDQIIEACEKLSTEGLLAL